MIICEKQVYMIEADSVFLVSQVNYQGNFIVKCEPN